MANGIFEFYPQFSEFLPVYQNVSRIWLGDGVNTGEAGLLYAEYTNGNVAVLGSVSMYALAVEQGYQGTDLQWAQSIVRLASLEIGARVSVYYQTTDNGTQHPPIQSNWESEPDPAPGMYVWSKIVITWADESESILFAVSYMGRDGGVSSVNGKTGDVILYGTEIRIESGKNQSIKDYIDHAVIELDTATEADIDAIFASGSNTTENTQEPEQSEP